MTAPFGCDGAFLFQPEEHGIERALIDGKQVSADLLDPPRDSVAVQRAQNLKSLEDHERQSTLLNVDLVSHRDRCWLPTGSMPHVLWESNRREQATPTMMLLQQTKPVRVWSATGK
jgi:hypothetical protein